jgi:SagB-type dehydrogenase family enzyme
LRSGTARRYHDRTTHSPESVRTSAHTLDWDIKPFPFKVYTELPARALSRELDPVAVDALAAPAPAAARASLETLAALLYYSAGVTRKKTYPGGGEVLFRAAASTGALYQTEVYVAAGEVEGLEPGLYHFCPGDFTLRRLRSGDVRPALAGASADASVARRAVTLLLTAIYWRNTWKYQARGYRHLFWDSGTLLANLLAVGDALGQAPRVLTAFVDAEVNRLLGVDVAHEAALELVTLGPEGAPAPAVTTLDEIRHPFMPLSSDEVDYPLLRELHAASSLETPAAVTAWRRGGAAGGAGPRRVSEAAPGALVPLPAGREAAGRGLGETIQRRGSTRQFGHEALTAVELSTALGWATRPVAADVPQGLVDLYLVVNAVEGVAPGAYVYRRDARALELVKAGELRRESAHLCLEQPLGGDAAAVIYFLAPLDDVLGAFGDRGYRLANLEAGIAGGRLYLGAYAQGFGASGLTFYDRLVVEFFAPHAAGRDAIFVTALGRSAASGRVTIGKILSRPGRPPA